MKGLLAERVAFWLFPLANALAARRRG